MDKEKAKKLGEKLCDKDFYGYRIESFINNGKSAAVFKAKKDKKYYALKIFDNDLVKRFGHEIQTKRIEQEISLKGHKIENLVKIHDGNKNSIDGDEYYFLVMNYLEGENLKDYIAKRQYNKEFILKVLQVLLQVSEDLLKLRIVHRDIKPENIMVDNNLDIILMDLGVLKLVGAGSFTDDEEKEFVGTLRYAPPEFLLRYEEDNMNGWKAVNLYQIGATLHDLIMKEELFHDITPYSNLVISIKEDIPNIENPELPFDLLQLTRDLLIKDWKKRLEQNPIEKIYKLIDNSSEEKNNSEIELEEILSLRSKHEIKYEELINIQRSNKDKKNKRITLADELKTEIDNILKSLKDKGLFLNVEVSKNFYFSNDEKKLRDEEIRNYLYYIVGELRMGFPRPLCLLVRTKNDDKNYGSIQLLGIFPGVLIKYDLNSPKLLFKGIAEDNNRYLQTPIHKNKLFSFDCFKAFQGAIQIDDNFREHLVTKFLKILKWSLSEVYDLVQQELEYNKKDAKGETRGSSVGSFSDDKRYKTILIFKEK